MTTGSRPRPVWVDVCALDDLVPDRGVRRPRRRAPGGGLPGRRRALRPVQLRPLQQAFVLSRGIVGSRGDRLKVASPIYKQTFDLAHRRVPRRPRRVACPSSACGSSTAGSRSEARRDPHPDRRTAGPPLLPLEDGEQYRFTFDMNACVGLPLVRGGLRRAERHAGGRGLAAGGRAGERDRSRTPAASTCRWPATTAWSRPACRAARPTPTRSWATGSSSTTPTSASGASTACGTAPTRCPSSTRPSASCPSATCAGPGSTPASRRRACSRAPPWPSAWRRSTWPPGGPTTPRATLPACRRWPSPCRPPGSSCRRATCAAMTAADDHRVEPEDPHWPLVALTLLTQLSLGTVAATVVLQLAGAASRASWAARRPAPSPPGRWPWARRSSTWASPAGRSRPCATCARRGSAGRWRCSRPSPACRLAYAATLSAAGRHAGGGGGRGRRLRQRPPLPGAGPAGVELVADARRLLRHRRRHRAAARLLRPRPRPGGRRLAGRPGGRRRRRHRGPGGGAGPPGQDGPPPAATASTRARPTSSSTGSGDGSRAGWPWPWLGLMLLVGALLEPLGGAAGRRAGSVPRSWSWRSASCSGGGCST